MQTRQKRIDVLRSLLQAEKFAGQDEIIRALRTYGFRITQATLSRDLRKVEAVKVTTRDGYRYMLPENPLYQRTIEPVLSRMDEVAQGHIDHIEFSRGIGVIHTIPGYAVPTAVEIDKKRFRSILGTVAGYDTIFIITREGVTPYSVYEELLTVMPRLLLVEH